MKRYSFSLILCVALAALCGCSKSNIEEAESTPTVTISATIDPATRTYIGSSATETNPVYWEKGDRVSINGKVYTVQDSSAGTKTAEFTGVPAAEDYTMVYPGDAYSTVSSDISIPTYQAFRAGSFSSSTAVTAVKGTSLSLTLHNVCGFLKLKIPSTAKSFAIRSVGGEKLTGEFSITFDDNGFPSIAPVAGQDIVHISGLEGKYNDGDYVVVAVPVGVYSKGFRVYVSDDNATYKAASTREVSTQIEPSVIYHLNDLTYADCKDYNFSKVITTADQLCDFLASADSYTATDEIVLGCDIDMSLLSAGKELAPASSFKGQFDGMGYSIRNWGTAASPAVKPLFTLLEGSLRNLVIDSSCHLSFVTPTDENSYYGLLATECTGTIDGCTVNADLEFNNGGADLAFRMIGGGMVGCLNGGKLLNCVNNGNVTITPPNITNATTSAACTQYFASMVGRAKGEFSIASCVNNGKVSVSTGADRHAVFVSGIVAHATDNGRIEKCENNGDVSYVATSTSTGGGVVLGGVVCCADKDTSIGSCVNRGTVSVTGGGYIKCPHVGGVGSLVSGDVEDCGNYGQVKVTVPYVTYGFFTADVAVVTGTTTAFAFATPTVGGVFGCVVEGRVKSCENHGDVSAVFTDYGSTATAYPCVGGVVGVPCGNKTIESCVNTGTVRVDAVNPATSRANITTGRQIFMGGITASCMAYEYTIESTAVSGYALAKGYTSISDCVNRGDVIFNCDYCTANHYIGGIIGLADKEIEGSRMTVSSCSNYGSVQGLGFSKCRLGGIIGANGTLNSCYNEGRIYAGENTLANSQLGGLVGFIRYHVITDCRTIGEVVSNGTATAYCGGMIGQSSSGQGSILGGSVDCTVVSSKAPSTSLSGTGIISGWTTSSTTNPFKYGTAEKPITVAGKITDSSVTIGVTQYNYSNLNIGGRSVLCGRTDSDRGLSVVTAFGGTPVEVPHAEGYVTDSSGNPWQGVVMSDGFSVTVTDANGYYDLETRSDTWYIYMSLPAEAEVPINSNGQPCFFKRYDQSNTRYDFTLKRLASGSEKNFNLICLADPQARAGTMSNRFKNETVPAIKSTISGFSTPSYGVTLGDVVYSQSSTNTNANMPNMRSLMAYSAIGMPVFQTMGNHDYTFFNGTSNPLVADATSSTTHLKAQRCFEECFGPINYSWNRGDVHIVCMRDIIFTSTTDASSYVSGFDDDQWLWLQNDLKYVPKSKMVILCVHIPLVSSTSRSHVMDALNLMKQYTNSRVFSGHTHYMRLESNVGSTGIPEHVFAAICGNWWYSNLNGDGSPNGYGVYQFEGTTVKEDYYLGTNTGMNDRNYQLRIYRGNMITGGSYEYFQWQHGGNVVLANVFNAGSDWTVTLYENGTYSGTMTKISPSKYSGAYDESVSPTMIPNTSSQDWWAIGYHIGVVGRGHKSGTRSSYISSGYHMYKYTLKDSTSDVKVVAKDKYGHTYECSSFFKDKEYPAYCASGNH